jgi:hypothetical protein
VATTSLPASEHRAEDHCGAGFACRMIFLKQQAPFSLLDENER